MSMVSIIIATYNSEKTLKRALDSVLNQSYQDWECIVVDGASKDNTIGIVKEYVKKDSRFRYISEPDHGIYDAFNKGWKMAKGEWVMYLGSDDEYTMDGIKALMENSDGADVVYGAVYLSYPNGKQKFQQSYDSKCLFKGRFMPCCHQSLMMKRRIIENLGGFDESYKILADKELVIRTLVSHYHFARINEAVSIFSIGGISQDNYNCDFENYKMYSKYENKVLLVPYLLGKLIRRTLIILKHKLFMS